MTRKPYLPASVTFLLSCFCAASMLAQQPSLFARQPSELLVAFERSNGSLAGADGDIIHVLMHPRDYPASNLAILLDGLESLALTASSSQLRAASIMALSIPGSSHRPLPIQSTMVRLERVYQHTTDPLVRGVIIAVMPDRIEKQEALAFLEHVAVKAPEDADFSGAASRAVATLEAMGADGQKVLRRIHEENLARDPEVRRDLKVLSKRGYRSE